MTGDELVWIKSTRSMGTGACVELAADGHVIAVRNSRDPDAVQRYTIPEIAAFLQAAKLGEFDHLVSGVTFSDQSS